MDSDNTGYGIFETGINKWDNWIENGKYLIAYDDSEFKKLERKTIKKALEILESNTHLKFVKYGDYTCTSDAHPCSWYMKFQRTKKGFSIYLNCRAPTAFKEPRRPNHLVVFFPFLSFKTHTAGVRGCQGFSKYSHYMLLNLLKFRARKHFRQLLEEKRNLVRILFSFQ